METNLKLVTSNYPFPCRQSIKPYLTFKINHLRTNKKIASERKKLTHLEKVISGNSQKNKYEFIKTMSR
jgi:hypothetical protein